MLRSACRLAALAGLVTAAPAGARALPSCASTHWVGAWEAAPSDASRGSDIADLFDPSGHLKSTTRDETTRAILTPTLGGRRLRVRLSNRFGPAPVTFDRTTIARRATGPALVPGTLRSLTFGGKASVTVPAGEDVLSDPVGLSFAAFQTLAVSVFVAGDAGKPTSHFTARQTSYLTPEGAGDRTMEVSGESFTEPTTTRPFVTGIDVRAPRSTGAVVALGDSITDGYQGAPAGIPETAEGIDADGRWPDVLARRLRAAGRPLSVLNAGISGNRVLRDGVEGGNRDTYGPAAVHRLDADALGQAGVTTVILLEGINDIGQAPGATAAEIVAGYRRLIERLHAAGLRVLQGTLTPTRGTNNGYDDAEGAAARRAVNAWIRRHSPADAVVDFDAAVRDPRHPGRLDPRYDGSDHLHLNLAGYRRMGQAVPLRWLAGAVCARPPAVRVVDRR
jgi:lysophospholipase L1-like esterase